MKSKRFRRFYAAALLSSSSVFAGLLAGADALDEQLKSHRTGDALSCSSCHAETRVVTGGTAGLGDRRADPFFVSAVIDQVSEASILALADPADADANGISGRAVWVWSLRDRRPAVGRFGWKATVGTLEDQIANALATDMGLANALLDYADATCFPDEPGCLIARRSAGSSNLLPRLSHAVRMSKPSDSPPNGSIYRAGLALLAQVGCTACHQPVLADPVGQPLVLFSDLLLHDLGPDLSEAQRVGSAGLSEWRTAPLLGLSQRSAFLHDGRAETITDAVTAHGGEATESKNLFLALSDADSLELIEFLLSL